MTETQIVSLGNLVNIRVSSSESQDIIPKMDSILGYIDQIKEINVEDFDLDVNSVNPILRTDIPRDDTEFSAEFMSGVPQKENGYVKVIKVLGTE